MAPTDTDADNATPTLTRAQETAARLRAQRVDAEHTEGGDITDGEIAGMAVQRVSGGRFAPGVSGNPLGRAPRATEDRYLRGLTAALDERTWLSIVDVAIAHAMAGDARAREWLGWYAMGKPIERVKVQSESTVLAGVLAALRAEDGGAEGEG